MMTSCCYYIQLGVTCIPIWHREDTQGGHHQVYAYLLSGHHGVRHGATFLLQQMASDPFHMGVC